MAFTVGGELESYLAMPAVRGAPYAVIAVIVAAFVPLWLSRLGTRKGASLPSWLAGDSTADTNKPPIAIGPAVWTGLVGAIIAFLAYAGYTMWWRPNTAMASSWYALLIIPHTSQVLPSAILAGAAVCAALRARVAHAAMAAVATLEGRERAANAVRELQQPYALPATAALREVHDACLAMFTICEGAINA